MGKQNARLSFRVPQLLRAQMENLARREGVTKSILARRVLKDFLARHGPSDGQGFAWVPLDEE